MKKEQIKTVNAPEAIGPYSQAIKVGEFVFVSGQIPIDIKSGENVKEIEKAFQIIIENLKSILIKAGSSLEKIVKITVFLTDMDKFGKLNEEYKKYFNKPYPAREVVEVNKLPKDSIIEISVIAHI